jgi:hypothetical protein
MNYGYFYSPDSLVNISGRLRPPPRLWHGYRRRRHAASAVTGRVAEGRVGCVCTPAGRGGAAANRPGAIPGGEVPPNRHSEQREHAGSSPGRRSAFLTKKTLAGNESTLLWLAAYGASIRGHHTMHSVPAADLSDWDDYEINLDQRVLSPEICMAACMAGRPAGWR